jgi:hypothetical protein
MRNTVLYFGAAVVSLILVGWGLQLSDAPPSSQTQARQVAATLSSTAAPAAAVTAVPRTSTSLPALQSFGVPDLLGLKVGEVASRFDGVDATFEVVDYNVRNPDEVGIVIAQAPDPGTVGVPGADPVSVIVGARATAEIVDRGEAWPEGDWIDTANVDRAGECANLEADPPGLRLRVLPCSEEHDFELVGVVVVEASGEFKLSEVTADLDAKCDPLEAAYVGLPPRTVTDHRVYPGQDNWASGNRLGYCFITAGSLSQRLVGSAAGSLW